METNKIPTAKEMLHRVELLWLEESVEEDVLNFTLEFAKMHVKKALEAAKKVNPQCMWSDEEECYIAVQNEYGIEKCYPLENIK